MNALTTTQSLATSRGASVDVPLTWRPWALAAAATFLAACGGGQGTDSIASSPQGATVTTTDATASPGSSAALPVAAAFAAFNPAAPDPGVLLLLLPDGTSLSDPRIGSWVDAAIEVGVRIAPVTDSQFAALGVNAYKYAGLVLPDDLHSIATDSTIAAVRAYVTGGGTAMLCFDFGALTLDGAGQEVYPIPKSRLSDLAGVDYVMYDELGDRTTGLGPVTGKRSMLRQLQVPPGKSMVYTGPTTAIAAATNAAVAKQAGSKELRYLPVSPKDPGGARGFDPQQYLKLRGPSAKERKEHKLRDGATVDFGKAIRGTPVAAVTGAATSLATSPVTQAALALAVDPTDAYTGYLIGPLTYASFVTRGAYDGQVLTASPDFGLVAGVRNVGAGKVMFVNMPLTYLKGQTDALPMHGMLGYLATQVLNLPQLSPMPNAVAGLTFDWHFDSLEAQAPALALQAQGVFSKGPFSIEMTAGPDTVDFGDGLGWNLDHNATAQKLLRDLDALGNSIGSHGGWIHDYYGLNASETNEAGFTQYLVLNKNSVDTVVRKSARSYSAPVGNNPTWAMRWLESKGVVGAYFGGHTGLGPTRQYRDGVLQTPKLTVFPVTPQGMYATFEEFQDFNVPKADVKAWYHDLVDFSIQQNTSRLVYAHPPGAYDWSDVLQDALNYAKAKGANFAWYTMPQLADFATKRASMVWTQARQNDGSTTFAASNAAGLATMVWRVPVAKYRKPVITSGSASVAQSGNYWLVKATGNGSTLAFNAKPA